MKTSRDRYDRFVKIFLIGDTDVGKSCLLLRYADDTFTPGFITTMGLDFRVKTLEIKEKKVKIQIMDTAGQGRIRTTDDAHLRGAHAYLVVFDLTNEASFKYADNRIRNIKMRASTQDANIILVGTKSDWESARVVTQERINEYVESHQDINAYVETSAKTGKNVDKAFKITAKLVLNRLEPTFKAPVDPEEDKKKLLIADLKKYISRIQRHPNLELNSTSKFDFSYGFWFYKNSRAINREANYYLAKELLKKLEETEQPLSIQSIFDSLDEERAKIFVEHHMIGRVDCKIRGINSAELNGIIRRARKC